MWINLVGCCILFLCIFSFSFAENSNYTELDFDKPDIVEISCECQKTIFCICTCPAEYSEYVADEGKRQCKACNCGPGAGCEFDTWFGTKRKCICPDNDIEINGLCVDPCFSDPCQNGGTCRETWDSYRCDCLAGYQGKNCEETISLCLNHVCLNGGTCGDTWGGYVCDCMTGFEGQNCEEQPNPCLPNPCENGAHCQKSIYNNAYIRLYFCDCKYGYYGRHCETAKRYCSSYPCENGGTCEEDWYGEPGKSSVGYRCTCLTGYRGIDCSSTTSDTGLVVGLILGVFGMVVCWIFIFVKTQRYCGTKSEGRNSTTTIQHEPPPSMVHHGHHQPMEYPYDPPPSYFSSIDDSHISVGIPSFPSHDVHMDMHDVTTGIPSTPSHHIDYDADVITGIPSTPPTEIDVDYNDVSCGMSSSSSQDLQSDCGDVSSGTSATSFT